MSVLEAPNGLAMQCTAALPPDEFATVRRRMQLQCCKWDSQVGDTCALAPFALVLDASTWRQLARWAEALAAETLAAETELLQRPELWGMLGMPGALRRTLAGAGGEGLAPSAGRVMRFDFHPTADGTGWRVSEINSDVPGGYTESSDLPALMAPTLGQNLVPMGDPGGAWADAVAEAAGRGRVALLCAPGLIEDMQILAYMARLLEARGCAPVICSLRQLCWQDQRARVDVGGTGRAVDAIVRFYQAEWLAALRRKTGWRYLFAGARTPVTNPPASVLTESKGFPLVWDHLRCPLDTWRTLLPATHALSSVDWRDDRRWVLKEKYSNNGESVIIASALPVQQQWRVRRETFCFPRRWVAQERFQTQALATPAGPMRPCLGVYVVGGRVAGVYGRLSRGQVVDFTALDVAVLREGDGDER